MKLEEMQESAEMNISIEGSVERVIFRNEKNGYSVLSVECEEGPICVVGVLPQISSGEQLIFVGNFIFHDTYGEQFSVVSYEKTSHKSLDSIIKYLSGGFLKGIGPALAAKIVKLYGLDSLTIMKESPEKISAIKGISRKNAKEFSEILKSREKFQELFIFLSGYNISSNACVKAESYFGENALEIIKTNPYLLFEADLGVKFHEIDKIAIDLGLDKCGEARIFCSVYAILKNALLLGHTCLPFKLLFKETSKLLGWKFLENQENISKLGKNLKLFVDAEKEIAALKTAYLTEKKIARIIFDKISAKSKPADDKNLESHIFKEIKDFSHYPDNIQIKTMGRCIVNPITVITGGPGTGKTTILSFLCKYLRSINKKMVLAAPTGRAAKRMQEVTGFEAKTIHRLLEFQYKSEQEDFDFVFLKSSSDPIDADYIFIDEASMVDIFLMKALLEATGKSTSIIFMGDINQLPAVGAGNALKDIINSRAVECISLEKIYRQENGSIIALNSHSILNGEYPLFENKRQSECILIEKKDDNIKNKAVIKLYTEILHDKYGLDITKDVQILTPTKKGPCGTVELNLHLQKIFSGGKYKDKADDINTQKFIKGDKVIQTRNNYDISWTMKNNSKISGKAVLNGEIGFVTDSDKYSGIVTVLFDDERIVNYSRNDIEDIDLAYAITVHKSQGSEYKATVLVIPEAPRPLMNRNLLYTAFSRARQMVFVISEERLIKKMLNNSDVSSRCTMLRRLIEEEHGL